MRKPLVLFGGADQAREITWIIDEINRTDHEPEWNIVGCIDDVTPNTQASCVKNHPILGGFEWLQTQDCNKLWVIAAVGYPTAKEIVVEKASRYPVSYATIVHPHAIVANDASVDRGSVIYPGVIISTGVKIAQHVTINMGCTISHDCRIDLFASLSPRVSLAGHVTIKEQAFIGIGTCVKDRVTIGIGSTVGAGAAVIRDVPAHTTVVGVPAHFLNI